MNTKLTIIATVAALSLSTTAFAEGEGNGDPFPFRAQPQTAYIANGPGYAATADVGSQQYPAANPALSFASNGAPILPENGSNGPVQTANSLPVGFEEGTVAYMQAQSINRWYAQQADHRFATASRSAPRD